MPNWASQAAESSLATCSDSGVHGMDDFERRWKLIQESLRSQISGEEPRCVSSGRTLFGIKSSAEETIERVAAEMEEERLRSLRRDDERPKP